MLPNLSYEQTDAVRKMEPRSMTMQHRFERRHMICCMPYTMTRRLFIYFAMLQTSLRTARNDKKRVGQNKNIYQAPGTYIQYLVLYLVQLQVSCLFPNQPVIQCMYCVLLPSICVLDEGQLGQDRSGAWLDAVSSRDLREARDEQQQTAISIKWSSLVASRRSYCTAATYPASRVSNQFEILKTSVQHFSSAYSTRVLLYRRLK